MECTFGSDKRPMSHLNLCYSVGLSVLFIFVLFCQGTRMQWQFGIDKDFLFLWSDWRFLIKRKDVRKDEARRRGV